MADDKNPLKVIRCPVCLTKHHVPPGMARSLRVRCTACGKRFDLVCALSAQKMMGDSESTLPAIRQTWTSDELIWWTTAPLVILGVWMGSYLATKDCNGPEFLLFYLGIFFITIVAATTIRHTWRDTWTVSIIGCLIFEGTGVIRYIAASQAGMRKFEVLVLMMVIGGLFFFLRAKADGGGYGIGGSCSIGGCGVSGCGGGGCGGGGCGGCGGS